MQSVILDMVNRFGYLGILILIAVENVFPPIPSEVILTFGGFLTTCTRLHPAGVVLASTAGSLLGALVLYGAGTLVSPEGLAELLESRPMKLLGFRAEDAWKTIAWFQKKGQRAVLLGRCIPIIRSLISVPAGMAGMKMPGFLLYTIVGSTVWNLLLVGIGAAVGAAWEQAAEYVKLYADVVFFVLIVGAMKEEKKIRKKIKIEDLLPRDPIRVDLDAILGYVKGKTILVTGGGGSIGSEICRQLAGHDVGHLIIFDIYENNAYQIQKSLEWEFPDLNLTVLIGSVRDERRLESIFSKYRPDIVFHAAAHKHVPLMEDSPNEAIKNNVIGTLKTARTASHYQVKKFILISTDKAVNPTNIMGASKRLCEMVIQLIGRHSTTEFAAVRFGNVLGSNGSVIPLFRRQIEHGGPVTVTHPDIIRYFMTIPEAVSLVLEAGAYAKNGQIFVLNMGDPVRIADLAKNMIRLSGYEPEKEIKIKYIGLRPGEKLYEELLMNEEGMQTTENSRIFIGRQIAFDEKVFREQIKELAKEAENECPDICYLVKKMVPEYQYEGEKQG